MAVRGVRWLGVVLASLVLLVAAAGMPAGEKKGPDKKEPDKKDTPKAGKTLEQLLEDSGLVFEKVNLGKGKMPRYKVPFTGKDEKKILVHIEEIKWSGKFKDGKPASSIFIWAEVLPLKLGKKPIPPALVKKVSDTNNSLVLGNYGVNSFRIFFSLGFFFTSTLDGETLAGHIRYVSGKAEPLLKEFETILKAAAEEK